MAKTMTAETALLTHRAVLSYRSDDDLLDALYTATTPAEKIAACRLLRERGHEDLVSAWIDEQAATALALTDQIMAKMDQIMARM